MQKQYHCPNSLHFQHSVITSFLVYFFQIFCFSFFKKHKYKQFHVISYFRVHFFCYNIMFRMFATSHIQSYQTKCVIICFDVWYINISMTCIYAMLLALTCSFFNLRQCFDYICCQQNVLEYYYTYLMESILIQWFEYKFYVNNYYYRHYFDESDHFFLFI